MSKYTVKVFFNDGTQVDVECDGFFTVDNSHYYAVKDKMKIMTFPFSGVKYTEAFVNQKENMKED